MNAFAKQSVYVQRVLFIVCVVCLQCRGHCVEVLIAVLDSRFGSTVHVWSSKLLLGVSVGI